MPDSLRNALIGVGLGLLVLFLVVGCQPRQSVVGYTQVSPAGAVVAPAGVAGGTTIINNGSHGGHDSGFGSSFLGSMAGSMLGNALSRPSAVVVAPHAAVSPTYGATGIGSRTVTTTSPINRYGVMPSTGVTQTTNGRGVVTTTTQSRSVFGGSSTRISAGTRRGR